MQLLELLKNSNGVYFMAEITEYGILCSFEEWEEIQEKLKSTADSKILKLEKENEGLKTALNGINSFLSEGSI